METICSSETSVDTQRTTRRYIPEDGTLQVEKRTNYLNNSAYLWKYAVKRNCS
jgi:hypothetical protein